MFLLSLFHIKRRPNAGKIVSARALGGVPTMADLLGLRSGLQKTCVLTVRCGCCDRDWKDAVAPRKLMRLKCPHCGAINQATWYLNFVVVGES